MSYKDPVIKQAVFQWLKQVTSRSLLLTDLRWTQGERRVGFLGGFKKAKGAGGCQIRQTFQKCTCKQKKDGKVLGKNLILF